jgi:hypothetical protein
MVLLCERSIITYSVSRKISTLLSNETYALYYLHYCYSAKKDAGVRERMTNR